MSNTRESPIEQGTWTYVASRALCTVCGRMVSAGYVHPIGTRFAPHGVSICPDCVDDLVRARGAVQEAAS